MIDSLKFYRSTECMNLKGDSLKNVLFTDSPFKEVDSNLESWLEADVGDTDKKTIYSYILLEPLDNQQLLDFVGNPNINTVSITLIRHLVLSDDSTLLKNGFSNLFLVNGKNSEIYIVGIVFDNSVNAFVPYIYRTRNLYRAWNKGNRLHITQKL